MANRCYLYATDHLPGSPEWEKQRRLQSIGEWSHEIPLTFQLLLSGTPMPVRSSIWTSDESIALAGESRAGLESLNAYLALLPSTAAPLVSETTEFFSRPGNCRKYFVLECAEIFELRGKNLAAQNNELLEEIRALSSDIASLPVPGPDAPRGLLMRLFGRRSVDPLDYFYPLGLGNWSNILYYQFDEAWHPIQADAFGAAWLRRQIRPSPFVAPDVPYGVQGPTWGTELGSAGPYSPLDHYQVTHREQPIHPGFRISSDFCDWPNNRAH